MARCALALIRVDELNKRGSVDQLKHRAARRALTAFQRFSFANKATNSERAFLRLAQRNGLLGNSRAQTIAVLPWADCLRSR